MTQRYTDTDLQKLEKHFRTNLINSISGFKSLQLVGTISENNDVNLAVFNSIFHVGANPALIGMVVRPDGDNRSTLKNIIARRFYSLNNVKEGFFREAHQTSARYREGESEFETCHLTEYYLDGFIAPFVAQSNIKLGLELEQVIPLEVNNTTIVIGTIRIIELDNSLLAADGFVDLNEAGSITVAGLDSYYTTTPLARLEYAKPGVELKELFEKL